MSAVTSIKSAVRRNTDTKMIVSAAIGVGLFGLVTYVAVRSGLKPLKAAAKVVKS